MLKKSLYISLLVIGIGLLNISAQTDRPISKGVVNGSAVSLPNPVYPPAALAVRAGGAVNVQVLIDEDGNVISANAVSGHPLLRASAVEAAKQAKFKPTLLSGQAVKVSGVIVYNFAPPPSTDTDTSNSGEVVKKPKGIFILGDSDIPVLNGSEINLVKPEYPAAAKAVGASGAVNVRVTIDEEGNVVTAEAISGHPLLRASAVNAALLSKFKPTLSSGQPVKITGVVVFRFIPPASEDSSSGSPAGGDSAIERKSISGGVLNGKALSLPKPSYPAKAREERAGGAVNVQILIDEEGNVISASDVSGNELLRKASEQAALGAKFSPTMIDGVPVKVTGMIVYNFVP